VLFDVGNLKKKSDDDHYTVVEVNPREVDIQYVAFGNGNVLASFGSAGRGRNLVHLWDTERRTCITALGDFANVIDRLDWYPAKHGLFLAVVAGRETQASVYMFQLRKEWRASFRLELRWCTKQQVLKAIGMSLEAVAGLDDDQRAFLLHRGAFSDPQ